MEEKCLAAFESGRKEESLLLLQQLEDPRKVKDKDNWTLLHFAASNGWRDIVKLLVTRYSCDINSKSDLEHTPIYYASSSGRTDVVKYLCSTGKCDLRSSLSIARLYGHDDIVKFISDQLEDPSTIACKLNYVCQLHNSLCLYLVV